MSAWESHFAVAGLDADDVYRLHQAVWDIVSPASQNRTAQTDGRFLWAWEARPTGVLFHVRTPWRNPLSRAAQLPRAGTLQCRMAAGRQGGASALAAIEDGEVVDWFAERMRASGLVVSDVAASPLEMVSGRKVGHDIVVPTRRFTARFEVMDSELAWQAFAHGVGRSRGFGCGMLRVSSRLADRAKPLR